MQALTDRVPAVREEASLSLSRIGQASAGPLLVAMKGDHPEARLQAAQALGRMRQGHVAELLLKELKNEKVEVRVAAIEALGELRDQTSTGGLIDVLKKGHGPTAYSAADALAKMRDPASVEPLLTLKDPSPLARKLALGQNDRVSKIRIAAALQMITGRELARKPTSGSNGGKKTRVRSWDRSALRIEEMAFLLVQPALRVANDCPQSGSGCLSLAGGRFFL
jgi:HEAT repeat protein